jgi:hypothetical protein
MYISRLIIDYKDTKSIVRLLKRNLIYEHPKVKIDYSENVVGQKALLSTSEIKAGSIIFIFTNTPSYIRTRTSIQIGINEHIEAGEFGSFTNHSCNPNSVIKAYIEGDKARVCLIAIRDIKIDEEICFDYATTETDLTPKLKFQPCLCMAHNCRLKMVGFQDLSAMQQAHLIQKQIAAHYMNDYCQVLIQ